MGIMARRFKGKQLAKHLILTGSIAISGSNDTTLANGATVDIIGGVNIETAATGSTLGIIDAGFFPTGNSKTIVP
jgi:hypothetical protein